MRASRTHGTQDRSVRPPDRTPRRGQNVSYWREEPLEVDGVFEGSWGRWAVEVKTGPFQMRELKSLLELARRHPELRPLVICDDSGHATAERAGVQSVSWQDFLLTGPTGDAMILCADQHRQRSSSSVPARSRSRYAL